jgi:hypothetical protein
MTDDRRRTDGPATTDEASLVRFQRKLPRGDRSPLVPVVALVLLVAVAVLSSSPPLPSAPGPGATPLRVAAEGTGGLRVSQSPTPAEASVAAICLEPGSWRTATIETWRDRTVRVWRAIDPVPASGPDDPAIPIVPAVGSRIAAIGFCAPVVGPDRPTGPATVDAWSLAPAGSAGAGVAPTPVALALRQLVPDGSVSPLGGLFGPPGPASSATGWPPGVVVFRYVRDAGTPSSAATWFGIEILLTDALGRSPAASGGPSSGGTPSPLP